MPVKQWVKDLVEEVSPQSPKLEVGKRFRHEDGRIVEIVDGQYWGTHGLSNFWDWRPVNEDGTLGKKECGYGRGFSEIQTAPKSSPAIERMKKEVGIVEDKNISSYNRIHNRHNRSGG